MPNMNENTSTVFDTPNTNIEVKYKRRGYHRHEYWSSVSDTNAEVTTSNSNTEDFILNTNTCGYK